MRYARLPMIAAHDVRPGDVPEAGNVKLLPMELQEGIRTGHYILPILWVMAQYQVGIAMAKSRVEAIERLLHAEDIRLVGAKAREGCRRSRKNGGVWGKIGPAWRIVLPFAYRMF